MSSLAFETATSGGALRCDHQHGIEIPGRVEPQVQVKQPLAPKPEPDFAFACLQIAQRVLGVDLVDDTLSVKRLRWPTITAQARKALMARLDAY